MWGERGAVKNMNYKRIILSSVNKFQEKKLKRKHITVRSLKSYRKYLKSKKWAIRRFKIFKRDDFECRICGSKKIIQVHHRTYERLKKERDEDLITVCKTCHDKITFHNNGHRRTQSEREDFLNGMLQRVELVKWLFDFNEKYNF